MSTKQEKKPWQDLLWEFDPKDNRSWLGNRGWNTSTLIEESKNLPVFDIPVPAIDLHFKVWNVDDVATFVRHVISTLKADLSYPIILSENGEIMDGYHRICKAIIEKKPTVKAVRFYRDPEPDFTKEEE